RHHPAGLPRDLERQRGPGNHQPDQRAARLRNELEGHPGLRRDARAAQPAPVMTMAFASFGARAALLLAAALLPAAAVAAEPRGQVEVTGEIVTVGDLFTDAGDAANQPVFYAPAPGQSVEIGPNFLHRVALGFDL